MHGKIVLGADTSLGVYSLDDLGNAATGVAEEGICPTAEDRCLGREIGKPALLGEGAGTAAACAHAWCIAQVEAKAELGVGGVADAALVLQRVGMGDASGEISDRALRVTLEAAR